MKSAFYLNNRNLSDDIDYLCIEKGNPGIGGTQYMILSVVTELSKQDNFEVILFVDKKIKVSSKIKLVVLEQFKDIFNHVKILENFHLILTYHKQLFSLNFNTIKAINSLIIWAHNIIPNHELNHISKINCVKALVCVGKEQLDLFRDHKIFKKSTFIYNGIYEPIKQTALTQNSKRKNEVTYIGSLIPEKGFHVLAEAWPSVLKAVPNAKLNVIGSAKLYDTNVSLGKYNLAERSYENKFMPFLTKANGEIMDSVKFWGVLADKKNDILKRTKIGVPNPCGLTETFCLSAVEMQLAGCRVISKRYVGLLDTVFEPSLFLSNSENNLAKLIIKYLKTSKYIDHKKIHTKINHKFSFKVVIPKWVELLQQISNDEPINNHYKIENVYYNFKWLREFNRVLKKCLPFGDKLPTVDYYLGILNKFLKKKTLIKY